MTEDLGAHLGDFANQSTWSLPGMPILDLPSKQGEYIDTFIAGIPGRNQIALRLISARYSLEWIHHELAVTADYEALENPRKGDLAVVKIGSDEIWYRVMVVKRETASAVIVYLLDYGTEELVDFRALQQMPASVAHIPPLSFPLCLPDSVWLGTKKDGLQQTLINAKLTFKLEGANGKCFFGGDMRVYDATNEGTLIPLKLGLQNGIKMEKVECVVFGSKANATLSEKSFPKFITTDMSDRKKSRIKKRLDDSSPNSTISPSSEMTSSMKPNAIAREELGMPWVLAISIALVILVLLLTLCLALAYRYGTTLWRKIRPIQEEQKISDRASSERVDDNSHRSSAGHSARVAFPGVDYAGNNEPKQENDQSAVIPPKKSCEYISSSAEPFKQDPSDIIEEQEDRGASNTSLPGSLGKTSRKAQFSTVQFDQRASNIRLVPRSTSIDRTQCETTISRSINGERASKWGSLPNSKGELPYSDGTLSKIASLRQTSASVSTRQNPKPSLTSPVMQTTQRETPPSKGSNRDRKIHFPLSSYKSDKIAASPKTAIPEREDDLLSPAKRMCAGRSQGVWMDDVLEEETEDESIDGDLSERKIPSHLVLREGETLFYDSSFVAASRRPSPPDKTISKISPPHQEFSLHNSDLEAPRFEYIKEVLSDNKSTTSWALTPPSPLLEGIEGIYPTKDDFRTQYTQQKKKMWIAKPKQAKCFEYEIESADHVRSLGCADAITGNTQEPNLASLHVSPLCAYNVNVDTEVEDLKPEIVRSTSSSSFHSAEGSRLADVLDLQPIVYDS